MSTLRKNATKADPAFDFNGTWKNQRDSVMELKMAPDGIVTGEYRTGVGGGFKAAITGKARGDQIVFFVDWAPYSMTAWVGQVLTSKDGAESLETVWLNSRDVAVADEPEAGWSGIRTGGDNFTRK